MPPRRMEVVEQAADEDAEDGPGAAGVVGHAEAQRERQGLDDHVAIEGRVAGAPDRTPPAVADLLDDAVLEQRASGFELRRRSAAHRSARERPGSSPPVYAEPPPSGRSASAGSRGIQSTGNTGPILIG